MKDTPESVDALTKGMLRKTLFVVFSKGREGADLAPVLREHLAYMVELERQGLVFASGPLAGGLPGDGMTVLRARSLDEARAIAARDPFAQKGLRSFDVREWTVMEGSISLEVRFSDQSVNIG